jgi:formylglycine-generating enzyme
MHKVGRAAAGALLVLGCGRPRGADPAAPDSAVLVSAPSAVAPGAPRPGMSWIPSGMLHAGSALDDVPRVAEAEMPGVDVPMGGFYIDLLPWPNEGGAIPTTNVTRDEASRLCQEKGKRLCTELEWERACKGPQNLRYEYGATYDPAACGAGLSADTTARRPSGAKTACVSGFGVREMHGGAWEWTDSSWKRGTNHGLVAERGGNDAAGELVTRCAYGRPAPPGEGSPSVGFRCCAGPRNDAEVDLDVKVGPPFERTRQPVGSPPIAVLGGAACGPPNAPGACSIARAWTWRPSPNVELSVAGGCVGRDPAARCALAVSRTLGERVQTLAEVDTGREIPEVVLVEGLDRRIRVRGADLRGQFFREVTFVYGRVDVRNVGGNGQPFNR